MERTVLGIQVQSAREHFVIKLHTECKEKTPTKMQLFALLFTDYYSGLSWWLRRQTICPLCERCRFDSWVRRIPWRREWLPTPVFLPGEFHGQKSLVDYSPWGFSGQNTGVGCHSLLQGILPTQGSNPALQADSLPLSHQGSPYYDQT